MRSTNCERILRSICVQGFAFKPLNEPCMYGGQVDIQNPNPIYTNINWAPQFILFSTARHGSGSGICEPIRNESRRGCVFSVVIAFEPKTNLGAGELPIIRILDLAHFGGPGAPECGLVEVSLRGVNLIAARTYDKYSASPSIRPICTRLHACIILVIVKHHLIQSFQFVDRKRAGGDTVAYSSSVSPRNESRSGLMYPPRTIFCRKS